MPKRSNPTPSPSHNGTFQNVSNIGSGHNTAPKPFGQQHYSSSTHNESHHQSSNSAGGVQHLQYNSPSAIYSEQSKQEAYSRQTGHQVAGGE